MLDNVPVDQVNLRNEFNVVIELFLNDLSQFFDFDILIVEFLLHLLSVFFEDLYSNIIVAFFIAVT